MTATPTSPPGFRDGIEAAAKVAEREQDECAELEDRALTDIDAARWHEQARAASRIAQAIRAIPTPDTLPTGWNSDMGEAPRDRRKPFLLATDSYLGGVVMAVWPPGSTYPIDEDGDDYTDGRAWMPMPLPPPPPGE